jgi:hypothetical protein
LRPGQLGVGRVVMIPGPGGGFLAVPGQAGFSGRPKISLPSIPPAGSGGSISLPLNSYADISGLQQEVLAEADTLLTQECMAARGFVYTAQVTPPEEQAALQDIEYGFGVTSIANASGYGYGQPASARPQAAGIGFLGGFSSFTALERKPPAWTVALLGFAPGARIGPVRQESCTTQAVKELYGSGGSQFGSQFGDPVPAIAVQATQWTRTDPHVLAVSAAWSRCMAQRGYHYSSPEQPASRNWPATPTTAETDMAVADVTCKQQVNLANIWLTVEAAYQTALIGQNLGTLASLQASFQGALTRVEGLLARGRG